MTRRKKFLLLSALAFAACALAVLWSLSGPSVPDPEYRGKKLSQWLRQTTNVSYLYPGGGNFNMSHLTPQANEAILAMGTNAFPFLWRELTATDSPAKKRVISLLERQPIQALRLTPAETRRNRALEALEATEKLGTKMDPLVTPLLLRLHNPDGEIRAQTAYALQVLVEYDQSLIRLIRIASEQTTDSALAASARFAFDNFIPRRHHPSLTRYLPAP
jgi:hypothetical protein